jgi:tetratricopeptide (TPR) repeat protein
MGRDQVPSAGEAAGRGYAQTGRPGAQDRRQQPEDARAADLGGHRPLQRSGRQGRPRRAVAGQGSRQRLDEALKLNDKALNGSAYTSLATLYAKVPGWPVGFGDKERAEEYFKKALAINPDGIDPNFFYGEYLADAERYAEALQPSRKGAQGAAPAGSRTRPTAVGARKSRRCSPTQQGKQSNCASCWSKTMLCSVTAYAPA